MRQGLQKVKVGAIILERKSCGDLNKSFDIRRNLGLSVGTNVSRLKAMKVKTMTGKV
jgi:hypothetical protein